jgi:predicted GIY-YIG superfamily endonuclease
MIGNELRFSNRFALPIAWVGEENPDSNFIVYRMYSQSEDLLYVGFYCNLLRRMRSHRSKMYWWDFVDYLVLESCVNETEARLKEIQIILAERPEHNSTWNGTYPLECLTKKSTNTYV